LGLLRSIGLDNESPKWERAVQILEAKVEGWVVQGVVRVKCVRRSFVSKLSAEFELIAPSDPMGLGESSMGKFWADLRRMKPMPENDRHPSFPDAITAMGEETDYEFAVSFRSENLSTPRPDVVVMRHIRWTECQTGAMGTSSLERQHLSMPRSVPKKVKARAHS